jgi:hypothetical protein
VARRLMKPREHVGTRNRHAEASIGPQEAFSFHVNGSVSQRGARELISPFMGSAARRISIRLCLPIARWIVNSELMQKVQKSDLLVHGEN